MKRLLLYLSIPILLLACNRFDESENIDDPVDIDGIVLEDNQILCGTPSTKTSLDASMNVVWNEDDEIHGILVQLPVPKQISDKKVIARIAPHKDVDAFCFENVGRIMTGDFDLAPCTPAGIMELLSHYGIDPAGKRAVVIGRSNIVGKPMAMLLLHKNATVTVCHSRTKNLAEICRGADILVAAVGKARFVTEDMVKEGAVVIDVGMNRDENGKLCGDVDFENVKDRTSYITPVPGGVGPMTITMLMYNTYLRFQSK